MNSSRLIGIVVLVIGVVVLMFGINASHSPLEQVSETFTGRFTQQTTLYVILGVAAIIGGGLLTAFGGRRG